MGQKSNDATVKERNKNVVNALLMDAQITSTKEECAGGMEQRSNDAVAQDVQTKFRKEEYALGMERT